MIAVIMAGGKGTRIASVNTDLPKPMMSVCGKPILQWQIECLREQHITQIILVIGHLGSVIKHYFTNGEKFKVSIQYIEEKEPLGTAGALYYLKDKIREDFLLLNGDIVFSVDFTRFYAWHKACGADATLLTHPNSHPYDSGIIVADKNYCVTDWFHKEDPRNWYKNRVNAGIHLLSPRVFDFIKELKKLDLDRDILKPMIPTGRLFLYDSPEYAKDMGTPERYCAVDRDIRFGLVQKKNLIHQQKAVFLDRDGTINRYVGFLTDIDQFELIEGIAEKIRIINQNGYLAIVITNQPVIARGEVSWNQLYEIHNKMETLLGKKGAYIDDIFVCPHHPDSGYIGERIEYKISCECRKPQPGLLLQAAQKYNIDLTQSYMIGDQKSDVEAGKRVGCKTILIKQNTCEWSCCDI